MNDWMCPTLTWDDAYQPDRGKVLTRKELEKAGQYFRYVDKDGDGICPRTLPGTDERGAYFCQGIRAQQVRWIHRRRPLISSENRMG